MSYVDEVYDRVVAQNPAQPEFHQAVKEVLSTLRGIQKRSASGETDDAGACHHVPCSVGR